MGAHIVDESQPISILQRMEPRTIISMALEGSTETEPIFVQILLEIGEGPGSMPGPLDVGSGGRI